MGLGGYLTWTAAAREIAKHSGLKCFPFEHHGNMIKPIVSEIFKNNPNIWQSELSSDMCIPLQLNNPAANYCKKDTPQKAFHRKEKHIIEQITEVFGITNPQLRCEIYLEEEELSEVGSLVRDLDNRFVTIEPYSNTDYTPNRAYPRDHWQCVVDDLSKHIQVVQVGTSPYLLDGVVDFRKKTSFRITCGLIGRSELFLSTEGGLVHGATAFDTTSIVIITGYQDPRMVSYPQNKNVFIGKHETCGLKTRCDSCFKEANNHDPKEIVEIAKECLQM